MAKKSKVTKMEKVPGHLPGLAPERDPDIHKAAERLNDALEACGEANGKKKDTEAKLIEVLLSKGWKPGQVYRHGKIKVKLTQKYGVNVKEVDPDADADDADDDEDQAAGNRINPTGRSEVLDGVKELAEEGSEDPTK